MLPLYRKKIGVTLSLCHTMDEVADMESSDISFSASLVPVIGKKRKGRVPKSVAIVDTAYRRSTCSCTKRDGHMPVSMSDTVSRSRKKSKTQMKGLEKEVASHEKIHRNTNEGEAEGSDVGVPPETPLHVMHHVGIALGIEPTLLTEEQLKAPLKR
jgi:hypothetical protein